MSAIKPPSLELKHTFGLKASVSHSVHFVNEQVVAYPAGHSVVLYNTDHKTQEFRTCTPDAAEITAMTLSPNRRVLAVAERGDRAYVSFFDTHRNHRRARGLTIPAESSATEFTCVAFSGDGKLFLTQGAGPDWLLTLWQWDKAKPLVSVKTSPDASRPVTQVSFNPLDPTIICATGYGVCKFYRVADNFFKPITNSLAKREPLPNYLCHAWLPEERVIVGAQNGEILLFEHYEVKTTLMVPEAHAVDSLCPFSKGFFAGCEEGTVVLFEPSDERTEFFKATKNFPIRGNLARVTNMATSPSEEALVIALDNHQLFSLGLSQIELMDTDEMNFELVACAWHGPGSSGAPVVTGVDTCIRKQLVATCGLDRTVRVWNYRDRDVELVRQFEEEAFSIALHPTGLHVAVGFADKLRFMNLLMDTVKPYKEFNIKAARELRFSTGGQYLAVANGQFITILDFYRCTQYCSLQQLSFKVTSLAWSRDDRFLFSAGHGGAIFKWDVAAQTKVTDFVNRAYNWSAIAPSVDGETVFAVGAPPVLPQITGSGAGQGQAQEGEGCIVLELDFAEGKSTVDGHRKRLSPGVLAHQLALSHTGKLLFIASGEPEKPGVLRTYRAPIESGDATETVAHYGAIARVAITPDDQFLFSVGEDGVVCMHEIKDPENPFSGGESDGTLGFAEEILVTRATLEEDSLKSAELKADVERLRKENELELKLKDATFEDNMAQVTERFTKTLGDNKHEYERLLEEKDSMVRENQKRISLLAGRHEHEVEEMRRTYDQKMRAEVERYEALERERDMLQRQWVQRNEELANAHEQYLADLQRDYEAKLKEEADLRAKLERDRSEAETGFEDVKRRTETDADDEITELKERYEEKLGQEHDMTLKLRGENTLMKKKFDQLGEQIKEHDKDIKEQQGKEQDLREKIKNLEKDIMSHKKEIQERQDTINDKDKRIYDLRKKNQELEKFKFVLKYKINELNRQIEPKTSAIEDLQQQIKEMDTEMQEYDKSNAALDLMIGELRLKMAGLQDEITRQGEVTSGNDALVRKFRADLQETVQSIANYKKLKEGVVGLYRLYVQEAHRTANMGMSASEQAASMQSSADVQRAYARQREYLEKSVESLKRKIAKDVEMHRTDHMRLMRENVTLTTEINALRREIQAMRANQARASSGRPPAGGSASRPGSSGQGTSSTLRLRGGKLSEDAARRELQIQEAHLEQLEAQLAKLKRRGAKVPTSATQLRAGPGGRSRTDLLRPSSREERG